jgi:pimeloyl-ACP methyl ester carboxylesterase
MTSKSLLQIHQAGNPDKPAIVFLHGSPLSGKMWLPNFATLQDFHCLAPDLPGHGQSSQTGVWEMNRLVDELAEIIKTHTKNGSAHIVGLSYGGVVAQALISRHPEVVDKVMLSGTSARLSPFMTGVFKLYLNINKPFLKLLPASWLGKLLSFQFGIPQEHLGDLADDMKRMNPDVMAGTLLASYLDIQTPANTDKEILVVAGEKETPFAKAMARQLAAQIPNAKGMLIPKLGHVWNLQDPILFSQVLRWWFADEPFDLRKVRFF